MEDGGQAAIGSLGAGFMLISILKSPGAARSGRSFRVGLLDRNIRAAFMLLAVLASGWGRASVRRRPPSHLRRRRQPTRRLSFSGGFSFPREERFRGSS